MEDLDRYERVLKDLDGLRQSATMGLHATATLADKLHFAKVERVLGDARHSLRLLYFDAEDCFRAAQAAKEKGTL